MFSENDNNVNINNLDNLKYNFSLNDRFVHVKDENGKYFEIQTPFLKILKPIHTTLNKKKTIAKKYLILETNDELDFNNQIGQFIFVINKIHELSQEKIRQKSMEWFNTEFDDIGLDIKVRRPIDQQRDNEFIKISLPRNSELENEIGNLSKDIYVRCNIIFKGLKVSSEYIIEDWEIKDFITQEKYDEIQNSEFICNTINNVDHIQTLLEENIDDSNNINNVCDSHDFDNNIEENNNSNIIVDQIVILEENTNIKELVDSNEHNNEDINEDSNDNSIKKNEENMKKNTEKNTEKNTKKNTNKSINKNTEKNNIIESTTKEKINLNKNKKIGQNKDLIKKFSKKLIFS